VDQLSIEKKGIPTVMIVTTPFVEVATATMKAQGVSDMCFAIVEHPIAGYDLAGVRKKAETDFPIILKAATQWQPK
jgi:hypothetical protein